VGGQGVTGVVAGGGSPAGWLVVLGRVDAVFGDDFAGGGIGGGDVAVVDEDQDGGVDPGAADALVSEFAGVAQGDLAVLVDFVGAGAPFGFSGDVGSGLG